MEKGVVFSRREWLFASGVTLLGLVSGCDDGGLLTNAPLVGVLQFVDTSSLNQLRDGAVLGLQQAGLRDGKSVELIFANANGSSAEVRSILQSWVSRQVKLVVIIGTQVALEAVAFRDKYPLVFCGIVDPIVAGLATDLANAKPNITGVYNPFDMGKGMELLREVLPAMTKAGVIYDPSEPFAAGLLAASQDAAARLGFTLLGAPIAQPTEVVAAVQSLKASGAQAVMPLPSNTVSRNVAGLLSECVAQGVPPFSVQIDQVGQGVVAAVGIDLTAAGAEAGAFAARILGGEMPNAIPIHKASSEPLYLNIGAAQSFGITFSPATLAKAAKTFA